LKSKLPTGLVWSCIPATGIRGCLFSPASLNIYRRITLSDFWVFIGRKSGLQLESARWKEDAELLVLLPEKARTSIYARSSFLATLLPGACLADPFSHLCVAEPLRAGKWQPKCDLFRTERRTKTDSTVLPGWYCTANPKRMKGCTIHIPADKLGISMLIILVMCAFRIFVMLAKCSMTLFALFTAILAVYVFDLWDFVRLTRVRKIC
jgi:hypothetical protein